MTLLHDTWQYIKNDWNSYPLRFCAEFFAWACSVISAVIFAVTVPNIPVIPLYAIFITGCVASGWACYTRKSFGLMANSVFLVTIDGIGLIRFALQ